MQLFRCVPLTLQGENEWKETNWLDLLVDQSDQSWPFDQQTTKSIKTFIWRGPKAASITKRGAESTTGFPVGQYDGEMEFVQSVIGTPLLGHLQSSQCYEYLVSEGFHVQYFFYEIAWFLFVFMGPYLCLLLSNSFWNAYVCKWLVRTSCANMQIVQLHRIVTSKVTGSLLELEFHSFGFAKGRVQVIFTNNRTCPEKGNSGGEEKNEVTGISS